MKNVLLYALCSLLGCMIAISWLIFGFNALIFACIAFELYAWTILYKEYKSELLSEIWRVLTK